MVTVNKGLMTKLVQAPISFFFLYNKVIFCKNERPQKALRT